MTRNINFGNPNQLTKWSISVAILGYNGPWGYDTRKHLAKITNSLLILAVALFFHGIYLTLATKDLTAGVAVGIIGSFVGAGFLWRRGVLLWAIEYRIHALERDIAYDEGCFQMHEIKSLAEEINLDALFTVFIGGSEQVAEQWRVVSGLATGSKLRRRDE